MLQLCVPVELALRCILCIDIVPGPPMAPLSSPPWGCFSSLMDLVFKVGATVAT